MKILLLVVPALLIWWILRLLRSSSAPVDKPTTPPVENMVACEKCGLHVPEKEAIVRDGRHYCSEEHARETKS
ncbi:MAG: hypothetical protein DSZ00_07910 [Gammaproteobacteria bacterium]|nr:MAG: hypothetical protein DSZ02_10120 [Gammaproteobacteria bacterium]RTZ72685.1 MAG: hypothetical protein DSZ00_07910 [Gammaproteobacteria bacterium]